MDKHKPLYTLAQHITLAGMVGLSLALAPWQPSAWASDGLLHNIRFDTASRHFVIDTTGPVKASVNTLTIAGRKRVIIDLDNADIGGDLPRDAQLLQDLNAQLPGLKNVTVNQYGGNGRPIVRVLLDLQGGPGTIRILRNQGPHIELELSDYAASSPRADYPTPALQSTPIPGDSGNVKTTTSPPAVEQPAYSNNRNKPDRNAATPTAEQTVSRDLYNQSMKTQQELRQQIDYLQRQRASQSSSSTSAAELDQMKRTLVNMNSRYEQLEQENKLLKEKSVSASSSASSNELKQLQSRVNTLTAQNSELSSKAQALTSQNSEMQNRLTQALSASTGPRVDEMKRTLLDMNRQYEMLKQDKMLQAQQVEQMKHDRLLQNQQIQQLTLDKAALTQQIAQLKAQPDSKLITATASKTGSVSDTELQDLRRQLGTAQQAMNDALKTIKEQNQEMAYLRNQVNTVKAGIDDAAKEQITSLQNASETKDKTIQDLRQQLDGMRSNTSASSSVLQQRDSRISELEKALYQANQQLAQAQKAQQDLTAAKSQLSRLSANDQQRQDTERELGVTKTQIAQLQEKLRDFNASQSELASTKAQLAQLQADETQLKSARQDLTTLKAELERMKSQRAQSTDSGNDKTQRDTIAKLTEGNRTLSQQLQQANTQLAAAQKAALQSANGKATTTATSAQTLQLQKQVGELSQQLSTLRRENDDLKNSLASKSGNTGGNPDAEASYQEAKVALKTKKTADAIDKYKAALLLDPNNSRYLIDYSAALTDDQQYAEAIDVLRRYLQHNPLDREAYNQLGKIYLLNDQPDAANQSFMRAIPVSTINNYATSLKKLGRMDEAEGMFKLALSVNPKDSEVLFNLGNLYNNQNKLELARNKYLEAIQIRPDFAEAHYNLGLIFSKLGDNPKAVLHLEKFLQLSPNARNAETIRAYVQKLKA